jgi:hypothetical protein
VRDLWNLVFQMFGVGWVMPRRGSALLACWKGRVNRRDLEIVWNLTPSCLIWCIWREKNARSFEDCLKMRSNLQLCFLKSLFEWIYANAFLNISNFVHFCALLSCSWLCWAFSFVYSVCTWVAPPALFYWTTSLIWKKYIYIYIYIFFRRESQTCRW